MTMAEMAGEMHLHTGGPPPRNLLQRLDLAATRGLFQLPPRVQLLLSGRRQVVIDGQTLDPQIQLLMAARKLVGGGKLRAETAELGRARMREEAQRYQNVSPPLRSVRSFAINGPAGPIRVRHYTPTESGGPHPLLVFFHGGGFVLGDLDTHDEPCRLFCHHAGVHVLAVDYRLAPEHPFPAGLDDVRAALAYALAQATVLGADPKRVGVGGDSAGGNLAAVLAQQAKRDGGPAPAFQFLLYPGTDRTRTRPSLEHFREGFFLEVADIQWFDRMYRGGAEIQADVRVSPGTAPDVSGLCPAVVVTAAFDPLRDEGEAYAERLAAAGVPTRTHRAPGMIHGFINMAGVSGSAEAAARNVSSMLRELSRTS